MFKILWLEVEHSGSYHSRGISAPSFRNASPWVVRDGHPMFSQSVERTTGNNYMYSDYLVLFLVHIDQETKEIQI
jgi:hypothetical protein